MFLSMLVPSTRSVGPLAGVGVGFGLTIGSLGLSFFTGAVGAAFAAAFAAGAADDGDDDAADAAGAVGAAFAAGCGRAAAPPGG